jgi:MFS family permease
VIHASFYLMIAMPAVQVLGPFVSDVHYGGATAWAAISTGFGLGAVLGGFLAIAYKPRRILLVAEMLLLLEVPRQVLFATLAPLWMIVGASILTGIAMSAFGAFWATAMQQNIPERSLSRVSAYDWIGSFAFAPIGMALVGPVAEAVGTRQVFWYAAAYILLSTLGTLFVPSIRNLRSKSSRVEPPADGVFPAGLTTLSVADPAETERTP